MSQPAWPKPIRGVLIDLDGTLVDTEPIHLEGTNALLGRYGAHLDEVENAHFIGTSGRAFFEALRGKYGLSDDAETLAEQRSEILVRLLQRPLTPLPGAGELVELLHANRLPRAVASSSLRAEIFVTLQSARLLEKLPVFVSGHDDVEKGKPAPDVYLKAARRIGVAPESCVAIEDSAPGVASAKAAGAFVVAVPCPSHPDPNLGAADLQFESLTELVPALRDAIFSGSK
jgi:HAD superfamily hydrolase (TIGR01509 family)